MSKMFILQLVLIFIALYIFINIILILRTNQKERRISDFSLSKRDFDSISFFEKISHFLWKIVHLWTNKLSKSKLLVKFSSRYEKYIYIKEEEYKSPIDYITVKILMTIFSCLIYLILIIVDVFPINILLLIIFMIIGFILPDFLWELLFIKKCKRVSNSLYESIIILDDNITKTNIYNAINKVVKSLDKEIADEYMRILTDLSYNISLYQAFKRFYERTKIPEIKTIYHLLNVDQDNLKDVFSLVRRELEYIDKNNSSIMHTNIIINIMGLSLMLVPINLTYVVCIIDINYFEFAFSSSYGIIIMEIIVLLYFVLLYFIKIIGGNKK